MVLVKFQTFFHVGVSALTWRWGWRVDRNGRDDWWRVIVDWYRRDWDRLKASRSIESVNDVSKSVEIFGDVYENCLILLTAFASILIKTRDTY